MKRKAAVVSLSIALHASYAVLCAWVAGMFVVPRPNEEPEPEDRCVRVALRPPAPPAWDQRRREGGVTRHADRDAEEPGWRVRGESVEFVSDRPFKGMGVYDTGGCAPGGGGRYGSRLGGGTQEDGDPGPKAAEAGRIARPHDPVPAALDFLARHQRPNGGWAAVPSCADCGTTGARPDVAVTALTLLAFNGADRAETRAAARWILQHQDPDGRFGPPETHAIATAALAGLSHRLPLLREPAQRAVDALVLRRHETFDRDAPPAANPWLAGWCVVALRAAKDAGLYIPRGCFDAPARWLGRAPSAGNPARPIAILARGAGDFVDPGPLDVDDPRERLFRAEALRAQSRFDGVGLGDRLLKTQRAAGCAKGSWDGPGGVAAATSLCVLALRRG